MGGIHVILSCEIFCIFEDDLGFQIGEIRINEMTSFWKLTSTAHPLVRAMPIIHL